jgi:YidC/Oxa1 family membrane protein insertase
MFTTIIVQPIFNLLVLIYALLPGHNFGLAIIIFTVLIRLLMWPLVKKQLYHARAMRELQPEIKKIKQAAKGDRQKESALTMELYKEREINPFASLGIVIVQLPILIGLYSGLQRIIKDPHQIISFSYPALHHLSWMQNLSQDIHRFDNSLFGVVNLTRTALGTSGIYWAGVIIAAASAIAQYLQSKQLMPAPQDSRSLRAILKDAGKGNSAEQQEVNAAVGRSTIYLIPAMVFIFAMRLAVALPLYWLAGSVVAYIQQSRVLKEDADEADAKVKIETTPETKTKAKKTSASKKKASKRRKR